MSNEMLKNIPILYEDADCAVINKPPGLMVHSDGKAAGPFLADWVLEKYPEAASVGDPMTDGEGELLNRAGIVHRLDRETSGVLIIAKTVAGHAHIKQQFQDRTISKKYLAFVWGEVKEEFGTINRPIGRSASDFRKWSAYPTARGEIREAETYWTRKGTGVVPVYTVHPETGEEKDIPEKFSLVEVEPKTGRTHQIRVHFSAINHPVVCDALYAPRKPHALGFERLALHSWSISFESPSGKQVTVVAPLPSDFVTALGKLGVQIPKITAKS